MSSQTEEIKKAWGIFNVGPDSILEIRAISPKGSTSVRGIRTSHFRAADYQSLDKLKADFEKHALQLNSAGYNIYTVMNRIRPDFPCGHDVTDQDVIARTLLLVDIDRTGTLTCPASNSEVLAAKALADQVRTYLSEEGWPEPIIVMSGNGYHLYYTLGHLPNDIATTALIKGTLNHLAKRFNNEVVAIDRVVYNASRVTKLPGTIMRKGMETEDRPYRMAVVCDEA
jgi:hypothetical protein